MMERMDSQCTRRGFIGGAAVAGGWLLLSPASAAAPAFSPTQFTVETRGSGPDVILIPGLASSRTVWLDSIAALPGYRYHLVQLAGFAGVPPRRNVRGPIIAGVVEELNSYIAANRLSRPAVGGHSMGGTIGMMLAARYPARVGRLLVVDMLPKPSGLIGSTPERMRSLADNLRNLVQAPGGRELMASLVALFGVPGASAARSDPDAVSQSLHELATTDLSGELHRINAPTTIVYASPDARQRAWIDRTYAAAYRAVPHAKLVRIDGSGHLIMADQPVRFRAVLRDFLAKS